MPALVFTVHGIAQPAGSKRGFVRGGHVRVVDANPRSREWKTRVAQVAAEAMRAAGAEMLLGPVVLNLTFSVPRPAGHFRTGLHSNRLKPSAPERPTKRPDLLKLARAVEDALTGIVYRDDAQIVEECLYKIWDSKACVSVFVDDAISADGF